MDGDLNMHREVISENSFIHGNLGSWREEQDALGVNRRSLAYANRHRRIIRPNFLDKSVLTLENAPNFLESHVLA